VLTYVRLPAGDRKQFEAAVGASESVESAVRLDDDDVPRFQVVVPGPTPRTLVAEHGGSVLEQCVTPDGITVTAAFARGTNFDPVVTALEDRFGSVRVEQYGDFDGERRPGDPLSGLTERQKEVLTAAYLGGYFDYPREQSASEVADQLDVSRPAFQEVLRAAQRNLLDETLDGQYDRAELTGGERIGGRE